MIKENNIYYFYLSFLWNSEFKRLILIVCKISIIKLYYNNNSLHIFGTIIKNIFVNSNFNKAVETSFIKFFEIFLPVYLKKNATLVNF